MIALVFCGDLKYCPYIKRYLERLDALNADYKVYFWNRGGFELNLSSKYLYFDSYSKLKKNKFLKLFDFFKFRCWLLKCLKKDQPEKVVALSTLSGLILGKYLYSQKGSYIFDIRDYSFEHLVPVYKAQEKIIRNSFFTAISSKGFKNFLPSYDYVIAHNFNRLEKQTDKFFSPANDVIRFVWNGSMRYFDFQTQYLLALKNDTRFQIVYHGDGPEIQRFKNFCHDNDIYNVEFTGPYNNSEKESLLKNAHILNNAYGFMGKTAHAKEVFYAVSNRFYDGLNFHIPQVVEPTGFKKDWLEREGLGVSFVPDEHFADKLYDYYKSINAESFDAACNRVLSEVLVEDNEYVEKIDEFIKM